MSSKDIRYSSKWAKDFCLEVAKGRTVKEVIDELRPKGQDPKSPAYSTFWKWEAKHEELHRLLTSAYESCVMLWVDEIQTLSITPTPIFTDKNEFAAYREDKRMRVDVLKFSIMKLAPILSKKYEKTAKLDVSGMSMGPQVQVVTYATPDVNVVNPAVKRLK